MCQKLLFKLDGLYFLSYITLKSSKTTEIPMTTCILKKSCQKSAQYIFQAIFPAQNLKKNPATKAKFAEKKPNFFCTVILHPYKQKFSGEAL